MPTIADLMQLRDIIKSWPWSAPPSVDVYLDGAGVNLTIEIGDAQHKRKWSVI